MNKDKEPPSPTTLVATPLLEIEQRGAVVQLALNRPEKLNALNSALQTDLRRALLTIAVDQTVGVVILTGRGNGFCAGLDLKDFSNALSHFQTTPEESDTSGNVFEGNGSIFDALSAVPQPVIAAINGPAVTGGLELVLACDILLAVDKAYFADTHIPVNVPPGAGLSQRLARSIGLHRALAVSLTAEFFTAEEANQWGLVHRVLPPEALLDEAWRIAETMTGNDKTEDYSMLRDMKMLIRQGAMLPLGEGMRFERDFHESWAEKNRDDLSGLGGASVLEGNRTRRRTND